MTAYTKDTLTDFPKAIQAPRINLLSFSFNSGSRSKIDFIVWKKMLSFIL
jgi:hypothetical protein